MSKGPPRPGDGGILSLLVRYPIMLARVGYDTGTRGGTGRTILVGSARWRCEGRLRAVDGDMSDLCLGVDIGGTKTRVGVVTAAHQVLDVRESPTPVRNGAQAVLEVVATLDRELRGRWTDVAACGVGTAGV